VSGVLSLPLDTYKRVHWYGRPGSLLVVGEGSDSSSLLTGPPHPPASRVPSSHDCWRVIVEGTIWLGAALRAGAA
jgi:hypothetical protein